MLDKLDNTLNKTTLINYKLINSAGIKKAMQLVKNSNLKLK